MLGFFSGKKLGIIVVAVFALCLPCHAYPARLMITGSVVVATAAHIQQTFTLGVPVMTGAVYALQSERMPNGTLVFTVTYP